LAGETESVADTIKTN